MFHSYNRAVDLVIVGASFAGLSCAIQAAQAGLKVVVLEKNPKAGHHPGTTGLLVQEAADFYKIPTHLTKKISTVRLYDQHLKSFSLHTPDYFFLATHTSGILEWLAWHARELGVVINFNCRFRDYTEQADGIYLPDFDLHTSFLVGADGARSTVAKKSGLGQNKKFLLGIEYDYPLPANFAEEELHCFLSHLHAPGYLGWAVGGINRLQVGLAVHHPSHKPNGEGFLDFIRPVLNLQPDQKIGAHGGLIPVGGCVEPFYRQRILLIGDAAGLVSPLTAGGIRLSFELGQKSGRLIADYLQNPAAPHPGVLLRQQYPDFTGKKLLRQLWQSGFCHQALPLLQFPFLQKWLGKMIFFNRHSRVEINR